MQYSLGDTLYFKIKKEFIDNDVFDYFKGIVISDDFYFEVYPLLNRSIKNKIKFLKNYKVNRKLRQIEFVKIVLTEKFLEVFKNIEDAKG